MGNSEDFFKLVPLWCANANEHFNRLSSCCDFVNMNPDQDEISAPKHVEIITCVPTSSNNLPEVDPEKVFTRYSSLPPESSFGKLTSRGSHGKHSYTKRSKASTVILIAIRPSKMFNRIRS